MEVVMVETTQYETGIAGGGKPEDFTYYTPAEVLGTHDGYTPISSPVPELDDGTLNDAEAADYHACKDYMQTVRDTLTFIPVESGNVMPSFTTKDINGAEVDSSVFSERNSLSSMSGEPSAGRVSKKCLSLPSGQRRWATMYS